MIIDKLITLFGFEIDEKTLLRYKKLLEKAQHVAKETGERVKHAFRTSKPTIDQASASVNRFKLSAKNARRQIITLGLTTGQVFKKMGRRINRTASNILRFRNLVGVSIAGLLGIQAVGAVTQQGIDVEKRRIMLQRFEGSPEGAKKAEDFITQLALDTPLTVNEVTDAFIDMRQRGIDPTNGMLQALIDTNAAYGGSAQDLKLELLQIGQAWGKNKLQGQDLRILLEKRIPLLNALAEVTGDVNKSQDENIATVYKMVEAGEINREILKESILLMGRQSTGAAKTFARSMAGIINRFRDFKELFYKFINDSGFFDALKAKLTDINDKLFVLYETGELERYAKIISDKLVVAVEWLYNAIIDLVLQLEAGEHWTQKLTSAFGGFANMMKIVGVAIAAAWLWPLVAVVTTLGVAFVATTKAVWAFIVARRALYLAEGTTFLALMIARIKAFGLAIYAFLAGAGKMLLIFFKGLIAATVAAGRALLVLAANPIVRVIAGITALIMAIKYLWDHWDEVWTNIKNFGTYLSTEFPVATEYAVKAFNMLKNTIEFLLTPLFMLFDLLGQLPAAWQTMKDFAVAALDAIIEKVQQVVDGVKKISDSTFGVVGKFLGETAAKAVIGTKNLFKDDDKLSQVKNGLNVIQGKGPLRNTVGQNTTTNNKTTIDRGTNIKADIHVAGSGDNYATGQRIAQALQDSAKRGSYGSTTTIGY